MMLPYIGNARHVRACFATARKKSVIVEIENDV